MLSADYSLMRAQNVVMCKDVFVENIEVLESMQAGRVAPPYGGRKFSAVIDYPTHHFHKWVEQLMIQTS